MICSERASEARFHFYVDEKWEFIPENDPVGVFKTLPPEAVDDGVIFVFEGVVTDGAERVYTLMLPEFYEYQTYFRSELLTYFLNDIEVRNVHIQRESKPQYYHFSDFVIAPTLTEQNTSKDIQDVQFESKLAEFVKKL
ncbi:hypothetical protein [Parashewanella tropica]|uniref:hypothetical protein n=1 Tax=Parashewanella tropica TaxID=2547970 RepID=UPI0010594C69|nr:hypothetical protein [Parashewanella tropica]